MKTLLKIKRAALLSLVLLGMSTAAQAVTTQADGYWDVGATWVGGAVPAANQNNRIDHDVIIRDARDVRDLNLSSTTDGSITIEGSGSLTMNWDVNLGVQQWNTASGYTFNFQGRQFRFRGNGGTWTHNGDLDLGTADVMSRTGGGSATLAGTGTLTADLLFFGQADNITLNVDKNLVLNTLDLNDVDNAGTTTSMLNLLSGTTQTEALDGLSAGNTINFSGADAVLKVLSTDLSTTAANNAITAGTITSSVGTLTVSTVGAYTQITPGTPVPNSLTVVNGTGDGSYTAGTVVAIVADTPPAGQQFAGWTSNNGGSFADANSATTDFTMPASAATVTANVEAIPGATFALTVNGGTGSGNYEAGTNVTVSAVTPPGESFIKWTSTAGTIADSGSATTTFTMPAAPVVLTANSGTAQATDPTTIAAGAWTNGANWDSGIYPDGITFDNRINNAVIKHAMTIGASEDLQCYNLDLRDSNGSLTIDPSGKLYVRWDTTLGGNDLSSTSSNLEFSGLRSIVMLGAGMTWTHEGTSDFGGLDIWQRGNNNSNLTLAGSGLLSLDILKIGIGAGSSYQVTVDRDLTVNAITEHTTAAIDTLNLLSGTTTTDALYTLGTTAKVNFASTTAVLKVLSSNLSVEAAEAAIALDYITKTVSGTNANSIQATTDGAYTVIATSDAPPLSAPALNLEAPVVDSGSITTSNASLSSLLTSPSSAHNDADITLVWSASGDQGTTLAAWGANILASGNFATGAEATVDFADNLARNTTYTFRIYASKGADEAWSDAATVTTLATEFALPQVIDSNMVLQRNKPIRIWGKGDSGGTVTVTFKSQSKQTTVVNGEWMVTLDAEPASSTGSSMTISHDELVLTEVTLTGIKVGEVWRAGGQSNMDMTIAGSKHKTASESLFPSDTNLRFFTAPKDLAATPAFDYSTTVNWSAPNVNTSVVAYHFARDLQAALSSAEGIEIPVGIILTKDGGTQTQCWTPLEALTDTPGFELDAARALDDRDNQDPQNVDPLDKPYSFFYNGVVHPTVHYTIKGVIWYQGERNSKSTPDSLAYRRHFPLMIESWRDAFQEPNLPFYFVQMPRMADGAGTRDLKLTRESQLLTERDLPNTGMVTTMDVIDSTVNGQSDVYPSPLDDADYGLHPPFKMPLGLRLSAMARNKVYGESIAHSAPRVSGISVVGSKIVITFDHSTGGLISRDGQAIRHFTLCDTAPASPTDTATFVAADAVIVGTNTVEVSATGMTNPTAVRYAWRNDADLNLFWTENPGSYNPASYDPINDDPAEYGPTDPERFVWTEFFAISPFRSDTYESENNTRDRAFIADGEVYWVVNEDPSDANTCYAVLADSTTLDPQARTVSFAEGTETGVWHVYDQATGASSTLGAIGSNKAALDISIPQGGERVLRLVRAGDVEAYSDFAAGINWGGADSTESGDAEGDGLSNGFEYAFGSDPLSGGDEPALMSQVLEQNETQYLQLSYFENVLASDLSYSCLQTDDLTQTWTPFVPAPEDKTVTPVDGSAYQEVIIRVPMSGDTNFIKVEAQ